MESRLVQQPQAGVGRSGCQVKPGGIPVPLSREPVGVGMHGPALQGRLISGGGAAPGSGNVPDDIEHFLLGRLTSLIREPK